jgi:basic amino acid/polyamine antiporter, APA family
MSELKRELGIIEVTLAGVGIILGAGIYALLGRGAGLAGNAVWISFAASAIIALFTGFSYAELSSMFPRASAEYEYTTQGFGRRIAFVIGWLIIFSGVIGAATVAVGFGGYVTTLVPVPPLIAAVLLILLLSFVLFLGIKESASVAIIFTLIEAAGLILVIFIGLPYLGRVDYLEMPFGIGGLLEASALIFFAYLGFEEIVKMAEETHDPEKVIPRGLLYAVLISIVLYVLTAISAVSVVGWERLSLSDAPFSEVAFEALGGQASILLAVIALFATANTVLLMMYASSRITYGMAGSRSLPPILSTVHSIRKTPYVAVTVVMIVSMLFVFAGDIAFIANLTNFTIFVTFVMINATVILLRYTMPAVTRPFRVPMNVGWFPLLPLLGLLSCLLLLFQLEPLVLLLGAGLTIVGGIFSFFDSRYPPSP